MLKLFTRMETDFQAKYIKVIMKVLVNFIGKTRKSHIGGISQRTK